MSRALLLCGILISAGLLAGCTGTKPLQLDSTIDYVDRLVQMGYPAPITTDHHGRPIDAPMDVNSAKSVQILLDWEGADPWLATTKSNALFMTAFEKVHKTTDRVNWTLAKELDREGFPGQGAPEMEDRRYGFETVMHVDPVTDRLFVYHTARGIYEPTPGLTACAVWQQMLGLPLPCDYWACPSIFYSDNEGGQWTTPLQGQNPPPLSCTSTLGSAGVSNHPKIITAPRVAGLQPTVADKANSYGRALYVCDTVYYLFQTLGLVGFWVGEPTPALPPVPKCSISFDSGNTWERTTVITENVQDLLGNCQIINVGRLAAAPDGTVYVPLTLRDLRFNRRCAPAVAYTEDEGVSWNIRTYRGPRANGTNWENEPSLVLSPDGGTAYYFYRAENEGVYMLRSHDKFSTWQGPFRVSPASHTLDAYVSAVAGSKGRVAVAYFGTTDWQDFSLYQPHPPNADPNTVWKAFITTTFNVDDDAPIFVTDQVTTDQDPVQIGCTAFQFNGPELPHSIVGQLDEILDCPNQLNLQHLIVDREGRLVFGFTDGCDIRNDCTTDFSSGFQARDRQLSMTVQTGGYSIFEDKGILTPLNLKPPKPAPKCEEGCQPAP